MPTQGSLSIEQMCRLTGVSRAGFYRFLQEQMPVEEDMEVRSAIQQIAVEHRRRYGYRRIAAELRRRGMLVNHKRVARIMREDNLLAVQPRAFVVTTDSQHKLEVYLNLASRMKLTGVNQLWVADITYSTPSQRSPPLWRCVAGACLECSARQEPAFSLLREKMSRSGGDLPTLVR
jgi:putative transposase